MTHQPFKDLRKIIVGIDLDTRGETVTPGSLLASRKALDLAKTTGARVTLVHSSAQDESWDHGSGGYVIVHEGTPEAGVEAIELVAQSFRQDGIKTEVEISEDPAWLALCRAALPGDGLVLIGKRSGDEVPDGRRLGSVSSKLVRDCPGALMILKHGAPERFERILALCDLTEIGETVLRHAGWIAVREDAHLHAVHAIQLPMSAHVEAAGDADAIAKTMRDEALAKLEPWLEESGAAGRTEWHVGVDAPVRACLAADEQIDPDLIVMGTVARGGVPGLLIGNTAERLLPQLDASLLVLKPADFVSPIE